MQQFYPWRRKHYDGTAVIDFDTDTLRVMLVTSSYTFDAEETNMTLAEAEEVSGTNYTAGGPALASKTVTRAGAVVSGDAADITITADAGGFANARSMILYKDTGAAATDIPIAYQNFGEDKSNVSANLVLQISALGFFTSTAV